MDFHQLNFKAYLIILLTFSNVVHKASACLASETLHATAEVKFITSPNYPSAYDHHLDCSWTILSDTLINITFDSQYHIESVYDILQLKSPVHRVGSQRVDGVQYNGLAVPPNHSFISPPLTIRFTTDLSVAYTGFKIYYGATDAPQPTSTWSLPLANGVKLYRNLTVQSAIVAGAGANIGDFGVDFYGGENGTHHIFGTLVRFDAQEVVRYARGPRGSPDGSEDTSWPWPADFGTPTERNRSHALDFAFNTSFVGLHVNGAAFPSFSYRGGASAADVRRMDVTYVENGTRLAGVWMSNDSKYRKQGSEFVCDASQATRKQSLKARTKIECAGKCQRQSATGAACHAVNYNADTGECVLFFGVADFGTVVHDEQSPWASLRSGNTSLYP